MNPTITTEELLALTKSADLLRQTAEKAMRCDDLARELHGTRNDRDHLAGILEKVARACDGDDPNITPLDFPQLPDRVVELAKEAAQCQQWRDEFVKAENKANRAEERANCTGLQVIALLQELAEVRANLTRMDKRVGELSRENETLARNMPPEPPVDTPVVLTYDPACFQTTKVLGQQWCKTDRAMTDLVNFAFKFDMQTHYIVLCNVHQDVQTGALTYRPVAVKDLPLVP